ncbi:OmpP1/FadL family transporter [Marinobacter salicampi]|uniref:OmpP1/FadL family transporter n=1 Tax=Marinobacter salicampi TaxID=435907 RepID=UPI00140C6C18|nr:outer membrane protein transport protein [Marinobacter salicampi]
MQHFKRTQLIKNGLFPALLALAPAGALAGGFALNEQSASAMGVANAGAAAYPENATTVYFNPAGMTELEGTQVSFGAAVLDISADFEGTATRDNGAPVAGGDGGDFVPVAVLPNLFITHEVNENVAVGFGLHAPYGLKADYDDDFVGRFFADETELEVLNFMPSVAFKSNDERLSIGLGLNIMYAEGKLSKFQDFQSQGLPQDGYFEVEGDDVALSYNIGLMYHPTDATTFGAVFRSGTEFELEGDATMTNAPQFGPGGSVVGTQTLTEKAEVPVDVPDSVRFGVSHELTDTLTLLAGATWAKWSDFEDLDVISRAGNAGTANQTISFLGQRKYGQDGIIGHVSENWKDTWSASAGVIWQTTPEIALKAGYAFDETPVNEDFRTARIPSDDRHWLTLGGQYAHAQSGWTVDVAAGYLIIDDVDLNEQEYDVNDNPTDGVANVTGTYELDAWGAAVQLSKAF